MFDWRGFLRVAEHLADQDDECFLRSAVSRAYYAAFNVAKRKIWREDPSFKPQTGEHREWWNHFERMGSRDARSIGANGNRLRRWRNQADYDDTAVSRKNVEAAITNCRSILDLMDKFTCEPNPLKQ